MMERTAFCAFQEATMASLRFGPMPRHVARVSGSCSMMSKTRAPKAATRRAAYSGPIPRTSPDAR